MTPLQKKNSGSYYTPSAVAHSLVRWVVRHASDRLLDPSCGDGQFIQHHRKSVGVEQDEAAARDARDQAPWALIHEGDFFTWAGNTKERFECLAGNPPFIRYQRFTGAVREGALKYCAGLGASFSGLTSSWAPFLVAAASLLKPGGRMAFVIPAEVGHAPYAKPLLEYLANHFEVVSFLAVRRKIFADLSEDVWLLYADGFGKRSGEIRLSQAEVFDVDQPAPVDGLCISLSDLALMNGRLRPFLLAREQLNEYRAASLAPGVKRLADFARVSIGYVSGANDFFHLRPSQADDLGIGKRWLVPSVRNGRVLRSSQLERGDVAEWIEQDEPCLLLKIAPSAEVDRALRKYLGTDAAQAASQAYKCRVRSPWYAVPDVRVPSAFLSYMSGDSPSLVENRAGCTGTNSVHVVDLNDPADMPTLRAAWSDPLTQLSWEIEGHPLGGGMLKLEPREAQSIVIASDTRRSKARTQRLQDARATMQAWRHW